MKPPLSNIVPQIEEMDFSHLRDKSFIIGVSADNRDGPNVISRTIRGPFDFFEMLDSVHKLWVEKMYHAKVMILNKDFDSGLEWLDANTIDYIIDRYTDILLHETILVGDREHTCSAVVSREPEVEQ